MSESFHAPTQASQQLFCTGRMNNGWGYVAEFLNGRFTQIRWERSGQPPQVTNLTFYRTNAQGEPVYRGSFQAATLVTLVDLGKGNVRPGSQVSVGVEEWGWSRGNCGTSATIGGNPGGGNTGGVPIAAVQRNTVGKNHNQARDWLQRNGFFFEQTLSQVDRTFIERWNRTPRQPINMTIVNQIVRDVVEVR